MQSLVLVLCGFLFKEFSLLCFDQAFAGALGWRVWLLDAALMGLVLTVTVVGLGAVDQIDVGDQFACARTGVHSFPTAGIGPRWRRGGPAAWPGPATWCSLRPCRRRRCRARGGRRRSH